MSRLFPALAPATFGIALLAAISSAFPPRLRADDDPLPPEPEDKKAQPRDWAAWTQVPRLLGESSAQSFSQSNHTDSTGVLRQGFVRRWARVSFVMELDPEFAYHESSRSWRVVESRGEGGESGASRVESWSHKTSGEWSGSYSGPMSLRTDPSLYLHLRDGEWGFMTLGETGSLWKQSYNNHVWELRVGEPDRDESFPSSTDENAIESGWLKGNAPKQAVAFGARLDTDLTVSAESSGSGGVEPGSRSVQVQFWPDWNDAEVVVTIAGYEKWKPLGNLEYAKKPGPAPLIIQATLRPKENAGKASQLALPKVRRFRFELNNTSREPGVCMNWPVLAQDPEANPKEDPDFDLRFSEHAGAPTRFSPKKQKAAVTPLPGEAGNTVGQVTLDCLDFGAHADLRVIADLEDGREIVGFLEVNGRRDTTIRIPDREGDSLIARSWRTQENVTDDDASDNDDQPRADGQKGDGFSVYEEYRGFRCQGRHVSTFPLRKDLFVLNTLGARGETGLDLYSRGTADAGGQGIKVRYELEAGTELPVSRVINQNRSAKSPRIAKEPQHALILVEMKGGDSSEADYGGKEEDVAWRPKNVIAVRVLPLANDNALSSTIAHEVSHATGIRHHGDNDPGRVVWERVPVTGADGQTSYEFREWPASFSAGSKGKPGGYVKDDPASAGTKIRLYRESGVEIDPNSAKAAEVFAEPVQVWLAAQGGQHSGMEECWMRYNVALAYIPPKRSTARVYHNQKETLGRDLCSNKLGTGVNGPDFNEKKPRYGNATLGDCHGQLCVRDDAPDKQQKKRSQK
ncbi:hypothetical protein [Nibricoccus sp. IMCC34717]|uniref:hypothetical protein n=1 Tax=Nibricoccus sp. IMCC34717 TaxID=3034021 RepID=UPI00384D6712